jgi:GNAT superfamily N-acetyltransferase
MTKTPERIWLDTDMQPYRVWTIEMSDLPEYRRAALPAPDAMADARVVALVEALQWYESRRQDAIAAAESIHAREDAAVLELCRRHGYGAVIDAACRLWARTKDGAKGAFFIGGCIGDTSARDALEAAKGAGE